MGSLEVVGRYKGMSQCATRPVAWSGIKEASSRRPEPTLRPKNEASLHAYSSGSSHPLHTVPGNQAKGQRAMVAEQKKLERVDDEICVCGHWHDGAHDPDGNCLMADCPCVNDGEGWENPYVGQGDHASD